MDDHNYFVTSFTVKDFLESLHYANAINEKLINNKLIEYFGIQEVQIKQKDSTGFVYFYVVKRGEIFFNGISEFPETVIKRIDCLKTMQLILKLIDDFSIFYTHLNSSTDIELTEKIKKYVNHRRNDEEKYWKE